MIERIGRDRESAIAAWNTRAALASQQAVKGEPVAWEVKIGDRWVRCSEFEAREYASENGAETRRLYASPPSREPLAPIECDPPKDMNSFNLRMAYRKGWIDAERAHGIHSREGENK